VVLFMATIEHLEAPEQALKLIYHCTKKGGALYLTFPNYLNFPWLIVRILAEKLKKPNWIVLQPIDKIYSVFGINRLLAAGGFQLEKCIGTTYFPPILYKYEPVSVTRVLNRLRLHNLSFLPVLKYRK
jgi:2-polyprenyl-3-methyl-5-hydroxy-6-metoxy-1,4-benzoquinol methylase